MGKIGPFSGAEEHDSDEKTFYIHRYAIDGQHADSTMLVRAPATEHVITALANRGYTINLMIEAVSPSERGFRYLPDGTILVGASVGTGPMQVFGPFDDASDARIWIKLKELSCISEIKVNYTIVEPDLYFRIELVNGIATVIEFPPGVLDQPL